MKKLTAILFLTFLSINLFAQKAEVEKSYTKEIKNLTLEKQLEKAFQVIDELEPQSQSDLVLLTEIEAPPFKETKRALKYKEMLEEAGADRVWIDEVGNVLALKKGTKGGRTVALDAHLDTVFPEGTDVKVKYKGDTMCAPGIGDDTRGLVVVLTTLRALNKAEIQTEADLLFVGTVGEEGLGDLRGVRHLFESFLKGRVDILGVLLVWGIHIMLLEKRLITLHKMLLNLQQKGQELALMWVEWAEELLSTLFLLSHGWK